MSDWHLVERAQAGDMDAYGELYTMHSDKIRKFVLFRVNNNHADADDLAAEAWAKALRILPRTTDQGVSYGNLVVTIARNLVLDHFKSHRVQREYPIPDYADLDQADRAERQPEAVVVAYIANVEVLSALKRLTAEQQEVIILRYLHGLDVAETAQATGRAEDAVRALQYRAIGALRRLLPELTR